MSKETFNRKHKELDIQSAGELFKKIRDIPYALGEDGDIEGLLRDGKGGCARKHLYLLPRLQQLGYEVDIGIAQFDWRDLPIPKEILVLLKQPIQHHMFLYVGINSANIEIDATWDSGMKELGFPILNWDGVSPTGISVEGKNPRKQNLNVLKARSFISSSLQTFVKRENEPTPFNDAFNEWMVDNRLNTY